MPTTSRRLFATIPLLVLVLVVGSATPASAQDFDRLLDESAQFPEEYEDAVIDLVERYEELRRLLREQIAINSELFTEEEVDAIVADLRGRLQAAERDNARLAREYKEVVDTLKDVRDEELAIKDELAKTELGLGAEIETLEQVIDGIEEENLFQLGPTFSPSGRLGGVGIFNLPGTNLGLLVSADYALRERELTTFFGATFSAVPQRVIVEAVERMQARRERRLDARASETDTRALDARRSPDATVDGAGAERPLDEGVVEDEAGDDGAGEEDSGAVEDPADEAGSGTIFRPRRGAP